MFNKLSLWFAVICAYSACPVLAQHKKNTGLPTDTLDAGNPLSTIVISANRTAQKRTEAPVAISVITKEIIGDTKAKRLDELVNKVPGVFMVNLGNEQHEMSIRQPMTTRSLFLYLEDGVPIRTTGIYNHNALLEMNMAAMDRMEVIKGPASSLYGAEAIGGAVNVITVAPPADLQASVGIQGSLSGYKRADLRVGSTAGNFGWMLSGYYADRHDGPVNQTNFHKVAFTLRGDIHLSDRTTWANSITGVDYYADMGGGSLDSAHYARHDYSTLYTFNYRKTPALRVRSTLTHRWNEGSETSVTLAYRNNSVQQNPSYYVTNNFANSSLANGQVNNSSFDSYMLIAQHNQRLGWLGSLLTAGLSVDASPSTYVANYIRIHRDAAGKYASYDNTDSSLSNYKTDITNLASYAGFAFSPAPRLRVSLAARYDYYHYNFVNYLPPSASSGAPSTISDFSRFTPKVGATYNLHGAGFYLNYSQGYVPPQVTELFNSVKVPYLQPQTFFNYEAGGWLYLVSNRLYADYSFYLLNGTSEIISVRLDDGSYANQNAGKTSHMGVEYGLTWRPSSQWMIRFSGSNAKHTFIEDVEKGISYNGNEMAAAPHFFSNAEVAWKPAFIRGLRLSLEWQHQGSYYLDNANSGKYPGFEAFNVRAGYESGRFSCWVNALNALDRYYAVIASKSSYGYTYNLGDPREVMIGVAVRLGKITK